MSSKKIYFCKRIIIDFFFLAITFLIKSVDVKYMKRLLYIDCRSLKFLKCLGYWFFISPPHLLSSNKTVTAVAIPMGKITFSPLSV